MTPLSQTLQDSLTNGLTFTGAIAVDAPAFLLAHGQPHTAQHCRAVAAEALRLSPLAAVDAQKAETAAWLHDISAVIPNAERLSLAQQLDLEILPEEACFPMILHQKLSVTLARDIFKVQDEMILSAIGCHTTLKKDSSLLDQVVFLADKIAWDQAGQPPYLAEVEAGLQRSVSCAALAYLQYLWDRRGQLKVVHPWMIEAYQQLSSPAG